MGQKDGRHTQAARMRRMRAVQNLGEEMTEELNAAETPKPAEAAPGNVGYRYDPGAVDEAAGRIAGDIGGPSEEHWKDDPRNVAQTVLDIFLRAGVVVTTGELDAEVGRLAGEVARWRRDISDALGMTTFPEQGYTATLPEAVARIGELLTETKRHKPGNPEVPDEDARMARYTEAAGPATPTPAAIRRVMDVADAERESLTALATAHNLREAARNALTCADDTSEEDAAALWVAIVHGGDPEDEAAWAEAYAAARETRHRSGTDNH